MVDALLEPVYIGNVRIDNGLVLSPMSGVTTRPFRKLIKILNDSAVSLTLTEFISVEALVRNVPVTRQMMKRCSAEKPFGIQIFGYDVNNMLKGALIAEDNGADIVEINCGCPAPKVVKKGGGCELMRQPDHLAKIVKTIVKHISVPLTVKMRSGWSESTINALEVARVVESEGASAIAIHGRTRMAMYRGTANWDLVGEVAKHVSIPVFGSGDICCASDYVDRKSYGIAGAYIGRGAMKNPYIFKDIVNELTGADNIENRLSDLEILKLYSDLLLEDFEPRKALGKMKQLISQLIRDKALRRDLVLSKEWDELMDNLECALDKKREDRVAYSGSYAI